MNDEPIRVEAQGVYDDVTEDPEILREMDRNARSWAKKDTNKKEPTP